MNTNQQPDNPDNLDRILLEQDALLPSSGFAASVMDAIQQRAAEPAPIPFPWKLALPGIGAMLVGFAILCWLVATTVGGLRHDSANAIDILAWLKSGAPSAIVVRTQATPAVLAIAVSWACIWLCRKFASGSSAL
jgi:hypothetical protein